MAKIVQAVDGRVHIQSQFCWTSKFSLNYYFGETQAVNAGTQFSNLSQGRGRRYMMAHPCFIRFRNQHSVILAGMQRLFGWRARQKTNKSPFLYIVYSKQNRFANIPLKHRMGILKCFQEG